MQSRAAKSVHGYNVEMKICAYVDLSFSTFLRIPSNCISIMDSKAFSLLATWGRCPHALCVQLINHPCQPTELDKDSTMQIPPVANN